MRNNYLEYKRAMETQKNRVRKIRNTVNSLTNEVVGHLNKINRILTEVEKTMYKHPSIEENCIKQHNKTPQSY